MPVRVTAGPAQRLWIEGDGIVPVAIDAGGLPTDAVVPLLVVGTPAVLSVRDEAGTPRSFPLHLRPLAHDQRLIGTLGDAAGAADHLFPGASHVLIRLDPAQPLRGTPAAWEVLDAIACDGGPPPGATVTTYRTLLGCGVVFAVRSPMPPDDPRQWRPSWERRGRWWVLGHQPLGPTSALTAAAYAPVRAWRPGPSIRTPAAIVGLGIVVVLAAVAGWPVRRRPVRIAGAVIAVAATVGGLVAWSRQQPTQYEAHGTVAVVGGGRLQHDFWEYRAPAGGGAVVSCPCLLDTRQARDAWSHVAARPMLTSPEQASRQGLTLEVDRVGEPRRWTARLRRGEKLAFLTRVVDPDYSGPPPFPAATDSPLHALVGEAYLGPGVRVLGQGHPRTDVPEGFAEVFVTRDR